MAVKSFWARDKHAEAMDQVDAGIRVSSIFLYLVYVTEWLFLNAIMHTTAIITEFEIDTEIL